VILIDTLLQFEVHIDVNSALAASKLCPAVKYAITTGLRKANIALGYANSTPSFALLCPCGEGDPHPATIGDGSWICSMNSRVGKEFTPNQLFWTTEGNARMPEEHTCKYTALNAQTSCIVYACMPSLRIINWYSFL
jgi:hypothetical protein